MTKHEFVALITTRLVEHPEWLAAALEAITTGMATALHQANERAATKDMAMLAALALAGPGRVDSDLRKILRGTTTKAIEPENASQVERDFLTSVT